jgi:hypothetical protein
MTKNQLIEIMRISYLAGVDDKEAGCDKWCPQGSLERSQDLFIDFVDDGIISVDVLSNT